MIGFRSLQIKKTTIWPPLIGAILVLIGVAGLHDHLVGTPLRNLAGKLEAGETFDHDRLARFDLAFGQDRFVEACRLPERRSALTLALHLVDTANNERRSIEDTDQAYGRAYEAARALVSCSPADGNAWLRLAMVENDLIGPTPDVLEKINYSYWTAPNEDWILRERIRYLTRLVSVGVEGFAGLLRQHIARYAEYAPLGDVLRLVKEAPQVARPIYFAATEELSAERQEILRSSIEKLVSQ